MRLINDGLMFSDLARPSIDAWVPSNCLRCPPPAGTPAAIIDKLNESIRQIKNTPQVKTRLAQMGANAIDYLLAEFAAMIRREMEKWGEVVRGARIKPE